MKGRAVKPLVLLLVLPLAGCAYDHLQRADAVAYTAGDAVRANIEMQTVNPSRASMYDTGGLGRNGVVVPAGGGG